MKTVYLALGSNLGDREARLREAILRLEASDLLVVARSPVYETEPQDFREQGWFLNAVIEAQTDLFPLQLLAQTQAIEREMGRQHGRPGGPRTIDIDILLYGHFVIQTSQLTIPHRRMTQRRFVLEPLAAIAPDLRHPVTGATVREMLAAIEDQRVLVTCVKL